MSQYTDFSSLPPDQEQRFAVFEERTIQAGKKAATVGISVALVVLAITMAIVFSHDAPVNQHAIDIEESLAEEPAEPKAAEPRAAPAPAASAKPGEEPGPNVEPAPAASAEPSDEPSPNGEPALSGE